MGIALGSNFDMQAALPLDSRFTVADDTERNAIASGIRHEGLLVYVTSTKKMWQLQGGILDANWKAAGGGGGFPLVSTKTANYTLLEDDGVILGDSTSGNIEITLPAAATYPYKQYAIKKVDASANYVRVKGTIDGVVDFDIYDRYLWATIISDGTNWYFI